jgi:hypothetical protein
VNTTLEAYILGLRAGVPLGYIQGSESGPRVSPMLISWSETDIDTILLNRNSLEAYMSSYESLSVAARSDKGPFTRPILKYEIALYNLTLLPLNTSLWKVGIKCGLRGQEKLRKRSLETQFKVWRVNGALGESCFKFFRRQSFFLILVLF